MLLRSSRHMVTVRLVDVSNSLIPCICAGLIFRNMGDRIADLVMVFDRIERLVLGSCRVTYSRTACSQSTSFRT